MIVFMEGIFTIICSDLVLHFLGLSFVVGAGLLLQSVFHSD